MILTIIQKLSNYHIIRISFFLLLTTLILDSFNCKSQSVKNPLNNELFFTILRDSLGIQNIPNKVLILSEEGCFKCNQQLAKFIYNHANQNILFIIANSGSRIDYSNIQELKQGNIIYNYSNFFRRNNLIGENSAYITLKKNKIDTLININPRNFNKTIAFIGQELKN